MTRIELGDTLAAVNAALNATSALLLVCGRIAIARRRIRMHRALMLSALVTSSLFLASYLTRVALTGTHLDPHRGWLHASYIAMLGTHMVLAMVTVPLVLVVLTLALRRRFGKHRTLARWTFPIWLYVSVTGVLVYAVLYRIPA